MKKFLVLIAALILAVTMGVASAPQAEAVSYCKTSGTLGNPKIIYRGGSSSYINIWSGSHKHTVWYGHPQWFCPTAVWVRRGHSVYDLCNQKAEAVFWWRRRSWDPFHGKQYFSSTKTCAGFHSYTMRFVEGKN